MEVQDPRESHYAERLERLDGHPTFNRPSCELALNLVFTYDLLDEVLSRPFHGDGISLSAFNLMSVLSHQDNLSAPLNEIGRLLLVTRANVTGLVDSLVKRGMVERVPHPSDRRIILAHLLPLGVEYMAQRKPVHLEILKQISQDFTAEEKVQLKSLLTRLRNGIRNVHGGVGGTRVGPPKLNDSLARQEEK